MKLQDHDQITRAALLCAAASAAALRAALDGSLDADSAHPRAQSSGEPFLIDSVLEVRVTGVASKLFPDCVLERLGFRKESVRLRVMLRLCWRVPPSALTWHTDVCSTLQLRELLPQLLLPSQLSAQAYEHVISRAPAYLERGGDT